MRVIAYGPDAIHEEGVSDVARLAELRKAWPTLWVNVDGLGDAGILQSVATTFGLHPLAMEDVVHVAQRPKLEAYDGYLFIVARMARLDRPTTEQLSMFLGKGFLVTFQEDTGDAFDPVRERLRTGSTRIRKGGPDYLAYALLDAVIDAYFPLMEAYGDRLDEFELEIVARTDASQVPRLHDIRRELLGARRAVWPLREVVSALARDESPYVGADTKVFLRDAYDHTVQIIDVVETQRELAGGLLEMYMSMVSHRMNEIMKVLTIIATIFIPLTFVAGLYGMNFDPDTSPWNMPELRWRYGYVASLAAMAVLAGLLVVYFRRKGWIGRAELPGGHEPPPAAPTAGAAPPPSAGNPPRPTA